MTRYVVAGGVAAGMSAASRIRRLDPEAEILVFERSGYVSYGACGLPYFVGGLIARPEQLVHYSADFFRSQRRIEVALHSEVEAIDRRRHELVVRDLDGGERRRLRYDRLILATGARPSLPPVEGLELEGVHVLRLVEDGIRLRQALEAGKGRAVVLGGGYIGLEAAEAMRQQGWQVTLIEALPQPMASLDPEPAAAVVRELERNGVEVRLGEPVRGLEGGAAGGGARRVRRVVTASGAVEADLVLVATGIRPNSELAAAAGIETGVRGAIRVDAEMRTSDPDVWAAGDCAETYHLVTGRPDWIPLGTTANKQGRIAGENASGGHARFRGVAGTAIVKIFDLGVARTGLSLAEAKAAGFDAEAVEIQQRSRAGYYPGAGRMTVRLVVERASRRLLGGQLTGPLDAVQRVNTLVAALQAGFTADDLYALDLAYAPPFAPVWDPLLMAARQALRGGEE
ncbi:MAG: FAD-dependent oxidoreductase [Clostridia bacterium]|nr:FAD-dependent oxidoreductase [Clostridia bacterium]